MKRPKKNLEKNIMNKIMKEEVKIKPKVYFVIISALSILSAFVVAVVAAYSISILSLWIRIQNASGPAYGARRNLTTLVDQFPWWAIVFSVIALLAVIVLIKKTGSFYKIKLAYIVTAVLIIASIAGFALSYSQFPNIIKGNNNPNRGKMHNQQYKMK